MDDFVSVALDAHQPLGTMLQRVEDRLGCDRVPKRKAYESLYKDANEETLYGKLLGTLPVHGASGKVLQADFVDPCAFLVHAASICLPFFRLLQTCLARAPGNVNVLVP